MEQRIGIKDDKLDVADRGIALWRTERPEIDCSGKAITGRVLRLAETFMSAMNANMAQYGIRYSYYAIVGTLRASGKPYRMSPSELQNTLMITSGGLSNLLRKVEALGYIRRLDDPTDGRGVIVELTDSGFALSEEAMVSQAATERRLVGSLDATEQQQLAKLLKRLVLSNQ
ncbi:MAG: MarR family transcriptional regulator [Rhizobiaceae bacterium]|nr:MAG: MarR family transcriptional regulator [Rhizobiaceae bacterium]